MFRVSVRQGSGPPRYGDPSFWRTENLLTLLECFAHIGRDVVWRQPDPGTPAVVADLIGIGRTYALIRHGRPDAKVTVAADPAHLMLVAVAAAELVAAAERDAVEAAL